MIELVPERAAPRVRPCRRLLVVGNCGSGKSTLARRLGPLLGLPVVHLDREYWSAGWRQPETAAWDERVGRLIARESWVMDGQYSRTLPRRLERADGVLLLSPGRWTCLRRALLRGLAGGPRPDLPPGCPERFDAAFLGWVWSYPERSGARVRELLERFSESAPVAELRDPGQVERFVAALEAPLPPAAGGP